MQSPRPIFRPARKRAIGIIRVSETAGREGESFRSPTDQTNTLTQYCAAHSYNLLQTFDEIDVSGFSLTEISQRKRGLLPAIEMIEAGEADVLLLPWLDRIARNLDLYRAARKRIQDAGGSIEAVDFGVVTGGTAAQRFSSETLIRVAELFAELTAEKTQQAKEAAIAQGIPTFPYAPFGYIKDPATRRLVVVEEHRATVIEAFRMRERKETLETIRDYLRAHGCREKIGIRGVQNLLHSRVYLGELHFGKLSNLHAHEPIIDPGLWRVVQDLRVARPDRRTPSERLLSRLGVATCASCGSALVVGSQWQRRADGGRKRYDDYRCNTMGDCTQRVHIVASVLEEAIIRYLKGMDAEGHADVDEELAAAERAYQHTETRLNTLIELLDGLGDLAATRKKIDDAKAAREAAYEHWQSLRMLHGSDRVRASDWDILTFNEQRALVRARIKSIRVTRSTTGRVHSPDRIQIQPFTQ
ncbi:MAG TPA: recombinase family protein [Chloroflexota bacterium]|nr:recombinase family protein [Chloroflexota bacterium]